MMELPPHLAGPKKKKLGLRGAGAFMLQDDAMNIGLKPSSYLEGPEDQWLHLAGVHLAGVHQA